MYVFSVLVLIDVVLNVPFDMNRCFFIEFLYHFRICAIDRDREVLVFILVGLFIFSCIDIDKKDHPGGEVAFVCTVGSFFEDLAKVASKVELRKAFWFVEFHRGV